MEEKQFNAGEVIFSEGDVPDFAYIILSGKIELISYHQGNEVQTLVLEAGKVVGELAVFDSNSLRPYTARALDSANLAGISPEEFSYLITQCPDVIKPFINFAFSRIKATKTSSKAPTVAVNEIDVAKIVIAPASEKMKAQFKPIEISGSSLPFKIGGYPEGGEKNRRDQLHLYILAQANPLRVSRQQCEIATENKGLYINDLGSRFCTTVNGVTIGRGHGTYSAPLKKGDNEVILGTKEGDYKLIVSC